MPTRISGACNGCRSKKQKCSGDKSGCAQCEQTGVLCTWPEQRKRGPAKGYIEGLENRLHDTESLLLQLLPLVSTEQLQAATTAASNHDYDESGRASPDRRGSPPVLNKKTGIDYWENFPLTSVAGIRRWQQDCETHQSTGNQTSTVKPETSHSSPSNPMSSSADPARKCQSTAEHRSHTSFSGNQGPVMYKTQEDQQMSNQMMHNQNSQVAYNQQHEQHGDWQTSTINVSAAQNPMRQQLFSQVGYLSNSWPQQQHQDMHLNTTDPSQQKSIPAISNQSHSHLFW